MLIAQYRELELSIISQQTLTLVAFDSRLYVPGIDFSGAFAVRPPSQLE